MTSKPKFAIHEPCPMGLTDDEDWDRIAKYREADRIGIKIQRFYVDGELEHRLGFDICSFVAGEIKDVPVQEATIYDVLGEEHEAQIVLVHKEEGVIFGYLVAPGKMEEERARRSLEKERVFDYQRAKKTAPDTICQGKIKKGEGHYERWKKISRACGCGFRSGYDL